MYKIISGAFALLVLPEVLRYWCFFSWLTSVMKQVSRYVSSYVACSCMSFLHHFSFCLTSRISVVVFLLYFQPCTSLPVLPTRAELVIWLRDSQIRYVCGKLWRISVARGIWGTVSFWEPHSLVQDETQPRMVLCHKYFVAWWPELTILRRWPWVKVHCVRMLAEVQKALWCLRK